MSYAVYSLADPRDGNVYYIGMTSDPKKRLADHIQLPDKYNPKKTAWIQEIKQHNLRPTMHIIAWTEDKVKAHDFEMRLIHEYLEKGVPLLNVDIRRPFSHWTQVEGNQPILFYKVICVDYHYWVVGVVDNDKRLYRLRSGHKVYAINASAYAMRNRLNEQIAKDGAIII